MGKDDLDDFSDEEVPDTKEWIMEIVKTWVPAIFAVLFIRSAIAEPFRIPSGSMVPTLEIGDHILVTKYTYGFRIPLTRIPIGQLQSPKRGDVIVFVYPGSDLDVSPYHFRDTKFTADKMNDVDKKLSYWVDLPLMAFTAIDYVKRVVAIPGDRIKVVDNIVYINGKSQKKTFQ
ncbi:MAG: signal peptidase I [Myxococcota bacterium]|nr:signal peptidase I [Myxococcota bacterium]